MTRKSTKRSLIMCVLSMTLCLAMLIGSTYAWFSDKATTGKVTITAGNLKVGIQTVAQEEGQATDLKGKPLPFKGMTEEEKTSGTLTNWEPGKMYISEEFEIVNKGNLALKYKMTSTVEDKNTVQETASAPDGVSLKEVIQVKIVALKEDVLTAYNAVVGAAGNATIEQRRALWTAASQAAAVEDSVILPKDESTEQTGKSEKLIAILFWNPTDSTDPLVTNNEDNKYNMKNENNGKVTLGMTFSLNVEATQTPHESDAFGTNYDSSVPFPSDDQD